MTALNDHFIKSFDGDLINIDHIVMIRVKEWTKEYGGEFGFNVTADMDNDSSIILLQVSSDKDVCEWCDGEKGLMKSDFISGFMERVKDSLLSTTDYEAIYDAYQHSWESKVTASWRK